MVEVMEYLVAVVVLQDVEVLVVIQVVVVVEKDNPELVLKYLDKVRQVILIQVVVPEQVME